MLLKWLKFKSVFFLNFTDTIAEEIEIPSVFTSYYASQILRNFIIPEQGYVNISAFLEINYEMFFSN